MTSQFHIYKQILSELKNPSSALITHLVDMISTMDDQEGMIDTPNGPQHWMQCCLDNFHTAYWTPGYFTKNLPAQILKDAYPVVRDYIHNPDTKSTPFLQDVLATLFEATQEAPDLVALVRKNPDPYTYPKSIAKIIAPNPQRGVQLLIEQGMHPREMVTDPHNRIFIRVSSSAEQPLQASIAAMTYKLIGSDARVKPIFEAMLAHVHDLSEVHGRVSGKELTLIDTMQLAIGEECIYGINALPRYTEQLNAMANAHQANQAINDLRAELKKGSAT